MTMISLVPSHGFMGMFVVIPMMAFGFVGAATLIVSGLRGIMGRRS